MRQRKKAGPHRGGRKKKNFSDKSKTYKQKLALNWAKEKTLEELCMVTTMKMKQEGHWDEYEVMKDLMSSPARAAIINKARKNAEKIGAVQAYTPERGLAFLIGNKLSYLQYNNMRKEAKDFGQNILYPSYKKIQEEKKKCYPGKISITEDSAILPLQKLLDHTASRILEMLDEVMNIHPPNQKLTLISKWGIDGSSGFHPQKQKFIECNFFDDEHMLVISTVPLEVILVLS